MAYQVNFCETKEQLKHLAEVVTGKADGSPTGEDIDTSTLAYAGLVRDTLPELLSKLGWYSVGDWSSDPLISNGNEYVLYNGIRYVPLSIPYQVNSTANPDPEILVGTELKVITDVTDDDITEAQNDILGGKIFKGSNGQFVQDGDLVPNGTKYLKDALYLYILNGEAEGVVSSLDFSNRTVTIGGQNYVLDRVVVPTNDYVNVEQFAVGPAELDPNMLARAFAYAADNGKNIVAPPGKAYIIDAPFSATFESVDINFNGSVVKVVSSMQGSTPAVKINVSKFISVKNYETDANNLSNRPFEIFGTTDETNVVTDNVTARNIFGSGAGTLAVCGVRVVGNGASIKMNNTNVFEVDSDVGRSNTQGILASRGSSGAEGYRNVEILNTYLRNITEQGGSAVDDSDGVKVLGYSGLVTEDKTTCIIDNVTQINDSGKSCKRIVKTQVSTYSVKNITGKFSNCTLFAPVDNQYGAGTCENVDLTLDFVVIASTLMGMPRFSSNNDAPNDSGSAAKNVNVNAKNGSTCQFLTTSFLAEGDRVISRSYENWTIDGLEYLAFGVIESDNDDSFAEYKNLNLSKATCTGDCFLQGTDANSPLQVNYIKAIFENVVTDKVLKSVGLYSSNTSVWTRVTPVVAVNSTIQFTGHIGRSGYSSRPETVNSMSVYKARTPVDISGGIGRTVIKINDDDIQGSKFGYQFVTFKYKSIKSGTNISNVAFTVTWDTSSSVVLNELVESNVGVAQLKTPSASYDDVTGELEITFGNDQTTQQQAYIDIESTVDFTVKTVFNVNV